MKCGGILIKYKDSNEKIKLPIMENKVVEEKEGGMTGMEVSQVYSLKHTKNHQVCISVI